MSTTDYKLGWKYYAKFTELKYPNYKYIHLPVNSTFALPSDFRMAVYNIFRGPYYVTDNFTVSGYDMSVEGEYPLTISYTCPNGQVLTYTGVTLIVFGTSTWRTLWSGNTNIRFSYGKFTVDDVEHEVSELVYVCPVNSNTFNKYIGKDHTRKLRITCSVEGNRYTLYIGNTEKTHSHNVLQSYEFDFNYKIQGDFTTYANVYKTIAVNQNDEYVKNQMIVGHIGDYNNALICFNDLLEGGGTLVTSTGQNITITKIEVQE